MLAQDFAMWGASARWTTLFVCLGAGLVVLALAPDSTLPRAAVGVGVFCAVALAAGFRQPVTLAGVAAACVVVAVVLAPGASQALGSAALVLLFAFFATVWWNAPYSARVAAPGMTYQVGGIERIIPDLAFDGARPRLLRPELFDRLVGLVPVADALLARHGVRWIATYGTLLGAIRHGGLIPWDDDIDFDLWDGRDVKRMREHFDLIAADAAAVGCVLTRSGDNWKLAPRNFWRYPALDIYCPAPGPDKAADPQRMAWENGSISVPPDATERLKRRYGAEALSHVVHDLPFWDSGFVPAMLQRLLGYRLRSLLDSGYATIITIRAK